MPALPLFQSMATLESLGKVSLSSSNRLGHRSEACAVMPVMLPPGWARTRDSAGANRIGGAEENDGNCFSRLLKGENGRRTLR